MKSRGLALLVVAIDAIGIFALPSSVSLFSGQHTWYDLSNSVGGTSGVNNVPCEKCHAEWGQHLARRRMLHLQLST
ncbi:hypothetical protein C5S53_16305 [Methanophagales archaeon]|jgi:hypothetical protein|nr:hypothetical protein C5S53_16305 [Methanophagales archaeon]